MHTQTSAPSSSRHPDSTLSQDVWTRRCALRLHQLRPHGEPGLVSRIASELWQQVSRFNPEIAAEIEHDSGYWEH